MRKFPFLMKDERGGIAALTAIMLAAFVGLLALVIDLGHLQTVQNELQNGADACALRGARAFFPDNVPPTGEVASLNPDAGSAVNQASLNIGSNKSDNVALKDLPTSDIQVGIWNYETSDWLGGSPSFTWPPSMEYWGHYIGPGIGLTTRRAPSYNYGPVGMTLAKFFGYNQVDVKTAATAALSGLGGVDEGSPVLPFGPWKATVDEAKPGEVIYGVMRNDNDDTMGWTNLQPVTADNKNPNTSANDIKQILSSPDGSATPYCPTGSTVTVQNGVASSCIKAMIQKNNRFGLIDPDGDNVYTPSTDINPDLSQDGRTYADSIYAMPVFEKQIDANNPETFNQSGIVGFIPVKITSVTDSPVNEIDVEIAGDLDWVESGYGGGRWYGILATEPKLVK